jgi:hyperosmotically inducible periplasmic protein
MIRKTICSLAWMAVVAAMFVISAPVRASATDERIESAFKDTYVYRTFLKDDAVRAEATGGVVTLTGTVAEESHKDLAQDTATSLPGVTRVDNQLTTTAELAADKADTWIGRKVKLTLLFHRHVNGTGTSVEVQDGVVTLKGEASSTAQKELTTEYAADIDGVKQVENQMTIAATAPPAERSTDQKMDDASITAQVKMALLTHRSTSAVKTSVKTRNGGVTVGGMAKNAAEKALVTKLVTDIQGVTGVNNRMTIDRVRTK